MKEKWLNRAEDIFIRVMEIYQGWEERMNQFRKNQLEEQTGIDADMMIFFLKMKFISFVPYKWKGDIQKVLFS
ncbi:hypothetical protein CVD28_24960 [Bacillus sp. M6-12]|uniref:hypothetical protein n=1 Tax=Bacillus sp. M6-12 TaxID=2054166 RepID=UPI000C781CDB|nr:hypothetical protein [Bacillus sp. M6-12]PLS15087.1 hypothetical protein CVD28_24960 [Bacillus sp. M6-12]